MRKVLIVAHLGRAAPRIPGLAKYLPEFGWEPIILMASPSGNQEFSWETYEFLRKYKIIEVPYVDSQLRFSNFFKKSVGYNPEKGLRRQADKIYGANSRKTRLMGALLKHFKEVFYYPDQDRAFQRPATEIGNKFLDKEPVDALISSSSPVTSHIIAKKLKESHKIPWIADLRDLWSQNHNYPYGSLRRLVDRRLELRTLSSADSLVTVSEQWVENLKTLHGAQSVHAIPNGYDPDEVSSGNNRLTDKFTITYTGQIYPEKQDPSKILLALKEMVDEDTINPNDVQLRFFGYEEAWLTKEAEKYGLSKIVSQYGVVPRKVALEKQRESHLLLLLNFEDPAEKGWHSLKIFQYLAVKRPIIVTGGIEDDVKEQLLNETNAGVYTKSIREIKDALAKAYSQYKQKGQTNYEGIEEAVDKYSHREMAKKFANILDQHT